MKKKIKYLVLFIIVCISIIFINNIRDAKRKQKDIDTSIISYTVEDKVYGLPYINPKWVEYNKLSDVEKEQVITVPSKYITSYLEVDDLFYDYDLLPSRYSTRDLYPTTMYDQGREGLCWAYATTTMMESNLKVTQGIDVNFSQKHIDYLTTKNTYFVNKYNPYTLARNSSSGLFYGSEFGYNYVVLNSGFIPVTQDKFERIDGQYNIGTIADVNKIDYTITDTVVFPQYERINRLTIKEDPYINMLKSFIIKYGGVFFDTYWSTHSSGYNSEYFFTFDKASQIAGGHAMVIVGWDDNYGPNHEGAWIVQNSWSNTYGDQMFYYSYDLESEMLNSLVGIKKMVARDWDNVYNYTNSPKIDYKGLSIRQKNDVNNADDYEQGDYGLSGDDLILNARKFNQDAITGTLYVTYNKASNKKEKLNMVSITTASQNSTYKIYISPNGDDNYSYEKEVTVDMPGLHTINFKDDNIELNSDKFSIKVITEDGAMYTYVNAFTNNIGSASSNDLWVKEIGANSSGEYEYDVVLSTNSIPNGDTVKFILLDEENNPIDDILTKNITVLNGRATSKLTVPNTQQLYTKYTIKVFYNDEEIDSIPFEFNPSIDLKNMEGKGTIDKPYKITNVEQLRLLSEIPSAHFELVNDIDLSSYNEGYGWIPIKIFSGHLDGKGHVIRNLTIDSELLKASVGLFEKTDGATIENLRIENAHIYLPVMMTSKLLGKYEGEDSTVGILAGTAANSTTKNVYVSGEIISSREYSGLLFGKIEGTTYMENIMTIGHIESYNKLNIKQAGAIVGIDSIKTSNADVHNIVGIVKLERVGVFNHLFYRATPKNTCIYAVKDNTIVSTETDDLENNYININDIEEFNKYKTGEYTISDKFTYNNSSIYPIYSGINIINNISIEDNISIDIGEEYEINYSISPSNASYKRLTFTSEDEDIVTVSNGVITGINPGTAYINVSSNDGSNISKRIKVTVNPKVEYVYYYNGGKKVTKYYDEGEEITILDGISLDNDKILYKWTSGSDEFKPGDKYIVSTDRTLRAQYIDNIFSESIYDIDNNKKLIKNICYTSIEKYIDNLNINDDRYTVKIFNNNEDVTEGNIGTGYITKVYYSDNEILEYTNIVPGDVYSDGKINTRDAGMIVQYLVGMRDELYDTPQYYAMDYSRDGEIRLNDARLIQHFVIRDYSFFGEVCPNDIP